MSLTFLNPLILFGLAAAALPILIHRLTHRKALRKDFSAVRLLLQSQKMMVKPQRLKHLILLALRITAIAALVLMAARPMLTRPGLVITGEKAARAIIIDNSASMAYTDAQGQRYERAQDIARQIISSLSPATEILIIPTVRPEEWPKQESHADLHSSGDRGGSEETTQAYLGVRRGADTRKRVPGRSDNEGMRLKADWHGWMKSQEAAQYLASIPLSFEKGEPGPALKLGLQKLSNVKSAREIILISDMAKGDWQGFDPGKIGVVPADVHLTFLRIGGQARDNNMAVKAVRLKEGDPVSGTSIRLETTIANLSDGPADRPASGAASGPVDKPGSITVKLMLGNATIGESAVDVKTNEDRHAYFDLHLDRPGSINGQVRISRDNLSSDDVFDFTLKVREKIKVLIVDGDPRGSMRASESYYLSHALQPGSVEDSPFETRIISEKEFSGIGTIMPYDALFLLNVAGPEPSKIMPFLDAGRPVIIFLGNRVSPEAYNRMSFFPWKIRGMREASAQSPERITTIDYSHEALRQFSEVGRESLAGAAFHRYFKVDEGNKPLLAFADKAPLLLQASFGKGKIFLYTSSADADWNDLPVKAAYVPLVQGILKNAVALAEGDATKGKDIGKPAIPAEESDLAKLSSEDIGRQFTGMDVQVKEYDVSASARMQGSRQELWTYLLGFLLLVVAIETGVANRL